jgi:spore coat protein U-like protein
MMGPKTNLRRITALLVLLFAACGFALPAQAQLTARATTSANTIVVNPLSFNQVQALHFGNIYATNTAGTVTVAPSGIRTAVGSIVLVGAQHRPAVFAGEGTPNQRVDISIGAANVFLTGPGVRMRVRDFVIGSTPTAVLTTTPQRFRIGSVNGLFQFPVGATLEVGANQAPGIYRGTWNITLTYQ